MENEIVLKVRNNLEEKDVVLKLKRGIMSFSNPFEAFKIVKQLMKLDKDGWLIVGISGDPPELVERFKSELHIQSAKGEKQALQDIKDFTRR